MPSTSEAFTPRPVHLLVLLHGMWGSPIHLAETKRIYDEVRGQEDSIAGPNGELLRIIVPETNKESNTYDGIDWCGERVADEVAAEIEKLQERGETVTRFSVTGYSLGGLIARYLVGILHQRKFFDKITPVNFTTVATPHIGMILFPTFRSKLFLALGSRLLSRTGEQFYAMDKWSTNGRPLLEVMADPDRFFFQGLALFPHIRFYANVVNDVTVPYLTAAAETEDVFAGHEYNGITIELDEQYAPLIKSYTLPAVPASPPPPPKTFSKEWFKSLHPPLPPLLQRKFPWNILVLVALPILIPTFMSLVVVRLSLDARKSRSRIKLLEKDESYRERFAHVVAELEKRVEDAVADYIDDTSGAITSALSDPSSETIVGSQPPAKDKDNTEHADAIASAKQAQITPSQRKIVTWLNKLPNLKKELVYIHPIMNAHAVIIARDVVRFEHHKQGQAVLRHMADNFVM
ncbi:DUF676-domain-containing protein [Trametopsis cervina]|nr:DUF676-domain-containing protein [Trametopsis cervina]